MSVDKYKEFQRDVSTVFNKISWSFYKEEYGHLAVENDSNETYLTITEAYDPNFDSKEYKKLKSMVVNLRKALEE